MKPLRVSITLKSPMSVSSHALTLDGLLSGLVVRRAEDGGHADPYSVQHDLPLDRYESPSGDWVFKASRILGEQQGEVFTSMLTSRFNAMTVLRDMDDGLVQSKRAYMQTDGGYFKSTLERMHLRWMSTLSAYAVGDEDAVRDILSDLRYLGGRRALASGTVRSVSVEVVPDDECVWWNRPMPVDTDIALDRVTFAPDWGTLHAPYWKRSQQTEIITPIA